MPIKVGLENNFNGKFCAWVQDHPGVTATGKDGSEALLRVPQALVAFQGWVAKHTQNSWLADLGDFDVRMVELLERSAQSDAPLHWFEDDKRPLDPLESQRGLQVLAWQRADLLEIAGSFSASELEHRPEGESLAMLDMLKGIAGFEQQTLERLGLPCPVDQSAELFTRLATAREGLRAVLSAWTESAAIREVQGELWSARKLLRCVIREERERMNDLVRLMNYF